MAYGRIREIQLADWSKALLHRRARYKVAFGGRGGAKGWSMSASLLIQGFEKRLRIACLRETEKSIDDSSKNLLVDWIERMDLYNFYEINERAIRGRNGTEIVYRGLGKMTEEGIKGMESFNRVWVDEGHDITEKSWEILKPTMGRISDSEIWVSFNPQHRHDPVYQDFVTNKHFFDPEDLWSIKVNYDSNPFFPENLDKERRLFEKMYPGRYSHIYLGFPDDATQGKKVLPYSLVELCVEAWDYRPKDKGFKRCAGVDVSGEGSDSDAMVVRHGPNIVYAKKWGAIEARDLADYTDEYCVKNGIQELYHDLGGGYGDSLRNAYKDMGPRRQYSIEGIHFGSKVTNPKMPYMVGKKNEDFFLNRSAQLSWAIHLRALRTKRFMNGENVNPMDCLFINPDIPILSEYKAELSQPEHHEQQTSKIQIDKKPDNIESSPDLYDATVLAFADDSVSGLILS